MDSSFLPDACSRQLSSPIARKIRPGWIPSLSSSGNPRAKAQIVPGGLVRGRPADDWDALMLRVNQRVQEDPRGPGDPPTVSIRRVTLAGIRACSLRPVSGIASGNFGPP